MFDRMKAALRMAWGFLKVAWWIILLVAGIVAVAFFRRKDKVETIEIDDVIDEKPTSFSSSARERIDRALVDVRIEKAIIQERSQAKRKELDAIKLENDDEKRLVKLAAFLQENL